MTHTAKLSIDPWVASSLLQKSVRRGEADLAAQAALAFHRMRGAGIWRRFILIAFEDIGIGDLDLVAHVTQLSLGPRVRANYGPDDEIVACTARRLAEAPKDRSTDYLVCAAQSHPDWEAAREEIGSIPVGERIPIALDPSAPLVRRAIAAWYSSGMNGAGPRILTEGDLSRLMMGFAETGLPHPVGPIVEIAAGKTREPITLMLPLAWAALQEERGQAKVIKEPVPVAVLSRGVPLHALDKHTSAGKRAIGIFAQESGAVRRVLAEHVPEFRARDVAAMAAFYADAAPVARRLDWSGSLALQSLGLETDMMKVGCPKAGILSIVQVVCANLHHLNAIRRRLFEGRGKSRQGRLPFDGEG